MKDINKYLFFVAILLSASFSLGCATTNNKERVQGIQFSISQSGYLQGKGQLEQMIGINDVISEWYSDTGDATIRYACDLEKINEALKKIHQYSENNDTEIKVSLANGPLKAKPFSPLDTNAKPARYGLSVFIVNQTKQIRISSKELEWMIHFEFNLTSDEIKAVEIPKSLPIGLGGDLGSFIEFHENRRKANRNHENDKIDTTWQLFRGSFE